MRVSSGSVTQPTIGHTVGRRQYVDSPLGHAAPEAESGACHSNHQPNPLYHHRPLSLRSFPGPQSLGCGLWMSATSWLSAQGLAWDWPVVEAQYQALSVSSSLHFLLPLGAVGSQWHKQTESWAVTDSHIWSENERITHGIGIFISMPKKRGCLKP